MVANKTVANSSKKKAAGLFSKDQILSSLKFNKRKDLLNALLDEDKHYSLKEVETVIEKFMKDEVK